MIRLEHPVRRLSLRIGQGGIALKKLGLFTFAAGSGTTISVSGAHHPAYTLRVASPGPP